MHAHMSEVLKITNTLVSRHPDLIVDDDDVMNESGPPSGRNEE